LRRTPVLLNGEWAMVNEVTSAIDHSQFTIDDSRSERTSE